MRQPVRGSSPHPRPGVAMRRPACGKSPSLPKPAVCLPQQHSAPRRGKIQGSSRHARSLSFQTDVVPRADHPCFGRWHPRNSSDDLRLTFLLSGRACNVAQRLQHRSRGIVSSACTSAIAALAGSGIGAVASLATTWLTQHAQARAALNQEAYFPVNTGLRFSMKACTASL